MGKEKERAADGEWNKLSLQTKKGRIESILCDAYSPQSPLCHPSSFECLDSYYEKKEEEKWKRHTMENIKVGKSRWKDVET